VYWEADVPLSAVPFFFQRYTDGRDIVVMMDDTNIVQRLEGIEKLLVMDAPTDEEPEEFDVDAALAADRDLAKAMIDSEDAAVAAMESRVSGYLSDMSGSLQALGNNLQTLINGVRGDNQSPIHWILIEAYVLDISGYKWPHTAISIHFNDTPWSTIESILGGVFFVVWGLGFCFVSYRTIIWSLT
jgi:hypothetical protein